MSIAVLILVLFVISFTTLIHQCPNKVICIRAINLFKNYILIIIILCQIKNYFKKISEQVHGNRTMGQLVAFLVVCVCKGLAVSTIVIYKRFRTNFLSTIIKFTFLFQFVFVSNESCDHLSPKTTILNKVLNRLTEVCDYNVAINVSAIKIFSRKLVVNML